MLFQTENKYFVLGSNIFLSMDIYFREKNISNGSELEGGLQVGLRDPDSACCRNGTGFRGGGNDLKNTVKKE